MPQEQMPVPPLTQQQQNLQDLGPIFPLDSQHEFDLAREELERERMRSEEDSRSQTESDPIVEWMQKQGIPVTRESYLEVAYPDGAPDPLPAELEAELPDKLKLE